MTATRAIEPLDRPIHAEIRPPGSKSLTNRALLLAALADGRSRLTGVLDSVDVRVMLDSLRRLGLAVNHDAGACTVEVVGQGGRFPQSATDLSLENSGTSLRFLAGACAAVGGRYRLDGNARMRERPIGDLISSLQALGVHAVCELGTDCPPVVIESDGLTGGLAEIETGRSSQFLSALLMAAPLARAAIELELVGPIVSEPYIEMTIGVMQRFGVTVTGGGRHYTIQPQAYRATDYDIEPDASAASYFFAAAAITGGTITVQGLTRGAVQGDLKFVEALERMGCQVLYGPESTTVIGGPLTGIDIDMNAISDTAQTLATTAMFATGPTRIRNVAHMRHKETDRVSAVVTELRRLGAVVEEHDDGLTITPGPLRGGTVATYDDHRMAMSFALLGLKVPGIVIADPGCTSKTYPQFFDDLDRVCRAK